MVIKNMYMFIAYEHNNECQHKKLCWKIYKFTYQCLVYCKTLNNHYGRAKQTVIVCAGHRARVQVWVAFSDLEPI